MGVTLRRSVRAGKLLSWTPKVMAARVAVVFAVTAMVITGVGSPASAHPRSWFTNCTAFNKHWPHGVGKDHAHDHTTSTPVTDFKRSTRLYRHAMSINSGLDGDQDGIACEQG